MTDSRDPIAGLAEAQEERILAHENVRNTAEYRSEVNYLDHLTRDFVQGIRLAHFAFTRYPDGREWLLQSFTDDLLESSVSIMALGYQGVFNVGRREMRYMIESAVKYVFVDQQVSGSTPLVDRLAILGDTSRVPRSSIAPVESLVIRMIPDPQELIGAVRSSFGTLSGYTHLSESQLDERLRRAEKGEYTAFESARSLRAFNRAVGQVYDIVLALVFEGIGPAFTGDLFTVAFDEQPKWKFHRGKFVSQISEFFDYKEERKSRPRPC